MRLHGDIVAQVSRRSDFCKKADLDRCFIATNSLNSQPTASLPPGYHKDTRHVLSRLEFTMALLRLAIRK